MGGAEAIRYLARHGDARVARLVLLAPATPFLTRTADNPYGLPAAAFEAVRAQWMKDFPKWVADNTPPFFTPAFFFAFLRLIAGALTLAFTVFTTGNTRFPCAGASAVSRKRITASVSSVVPACVAPEIRKAGPR